MSPIRVLIDTNIFAGDDFANVEASRLPLLFRKGRIIPLYCGVFMEETLQTYGSESKRNFLLDRWIPFILQTCHRLCDDLSTIIHKELVCGHGPKTNILMSRSNHARIVDHLTHAPADGSWPLWHAARKQHHCDREKRTNQRTIAKEIRAEVIAWKKAIQYKPEAHGVPNFAQFLDTELVRTGRQLLPAITNMSRPGPILDQWCRNPSSYPYATTFVRDMLYAGYYAMTYPNAPLDLNAQADLNLLSYMNHSQILVTNERGFLRTAFQDLWAAKRKRVMSCSEFISYLTYV